MIIINTKPKCCPTCGHPIDQLQEMLEQLTPMMREIFDAIARSGTPGITRNQLIAKCYDHKFDQPENAGRCISTTIFLLNKRIAPYGLKVGAALGGDRRYRLKLTGDQGSAKVKGDRPVKPIPSGLVPTAKQATEPPQEQPDGLSRIIEL